MCKVPSGTLNEFSQLAPLSFSFVAHLSALEAEYSTCSNVAAADKLPTCDALSCGVWHAGPRGQCYHFYNASEDQRVWQSAKCVAANSCAPLSTTRTSTYVVQMTAVLVSYNAVTSACGRALRCRSSRTQTSRRGSTTSSSRARATGWPCCPTLRCALQPTRRRGLHSASPTASVARRPRRSRRRAAGSGRTASSPCSPRGTNTG